MEGPTILVIEHDANAREQVGQILTDERLRSVVAPDGASALKAIERGAPDLVVCGAIPDMSVAKLRDRLRRRFKNAAPPIVAVADISAVADLAGVVDGASAFLADLLMARVRAALPPPHGIRGDLALVRDEPAPAEATSAEPAATAAKQPYPPGLTWGDRPKNSRGLIVGVTLTTVLQMLHLERASCLLDISSDSHEGRMAFVEGEIADAAAEGLVGDEAVYRILSWHGLRVEMHDLATPVERRVFTPLAFLLMEAVRILDERAAGAPAGDAPRAAEQARQESAADVEPVGVEAPVRSPATPDGSGARKRQAPRRGFRRIRRTSPIVKTSRRLGRRRLQDDDLLGKRPFAFGLHRLQMSDFG